MSSTALTANTQNSRRTIQDVISKQSHSLHRANETQSMAAKLLKNVNVNSVYLNLQKRRSGTANGSRVRQKQHKQRTLNNTDNSYREAPEKPLTANSPKRQK